VKINQEIVAILTDQDFVKEGDLVIITKGDLRGRRGGTNNMKIVRAGDIIPDVDHFLE
jgi:pyruvate kinase